MAFPAIAPAAPPICWVTMMPPMRKVTETAKLRKLSRHMIFVETKVEQFPTAPLSIMGVALMLKASQIKKARIGPVTTCWVN